MSTLYNVHSLKTTQTYLIYFFIQHHRPAAFSSVFHLLAIIYNFNMSHRYSIMPFSQNGRHHHKTGDLFAYLYKTNPPILKALPFLLEAVNNPAFLSLLASSNSLSAQTSKSFPSPAFSLPPAKYKNAFQMESPLSEQ